MADYLLAHGASINAQADDGETALFLAINQQQLPLVNLLLSYGAQPNSCLASTGETPLHWAVKTGNNGITQALLHKGADPNARDRLDRTPLMAVVLREASAVAPEQVSDGIESNVGQPNESALWIVNALLDAHAEVNAQDAAGWTALYAAAYYPDSNNVGVAYCLLDYHAAVNLRANDGTTPLHIIIRQHARSLGAMPNRVLRLADNLLKHGADPNLKAVNGLTPLHEAIWSWDKTMAKKLLEQYHARADIPNNLHQTALDYCRIRLTLRQHTRRHDDDDDADLLQDCA